MATFFNGTEFTTGKSGTFAPTFEGAQARRERSQTALITRRNNRRDRRANRAI